MISPSSARPDTDSQPVTAVDLFVRSLSPDGDAGHAEAIVERLADLPDSVGVTVHVWGEAVGLDGPLATTEPSRFVLDRVASFRDWAAAHDAELLGFVTRETDCVFTDHRYRTLSLPDVALAATRGDELVGLAPVRTEDGCVSVDDLLDTIVPAAAGRLVAP